MKIDYTKGFLKQYYKQPIKVQQQFQDRINIFKTNPLDPKLRNHPLKGKYSKYKSINITGDIRALYTEKSDGKIVLFAFIGSHSQLY
jgi:addiction module RelE/StbE family toxin